MSDRAREINSNSLVIFFLIEAKLNSVLLILYLQLRKYRNYWQVDVVISNILTQTILKLILRLTAKIMNLKVLISFDYLIKYLCYRGR